eukprot:15460195-Alexandrium_andersonii.AAC.1
MRDPRSEAPEGAWRARAPPGKETPSWRQKPPRTHERGRRAVRTHGQQTRALKHEVCMDELLMRSSCAPRRADAALRRCGARECDALASHTANLHGCAQHVGSVRGRALLALHARPHAAPACE